MIRIGLFGMLLVVCLALPVTATVTTIATPESYSGDGADTTFEFHFDINLTSELVVTVVDADGDPTVQTENLDYTVSATNNDYRSSPGGTVTFTTAPASDTTVILSRYVQPTQDKTSSSLSRSTNILYAVDKLTMEVQDLWEEISRCFRSGIAGADQDFNMPDNWYDDTGYWYWNGTGFILTSLDSGEATISTEWADVLDGGTGNLAYGRTVRDQLGRPYINAKTDYNAVGNGSTDDVVPLQSAIDAASAAGGGVVHLPTGSYYISAALEVPSNVTIQGDGQLATTILHGDDNGIEVADSAWYMRLEDFSIKPLTTLPADANYACIHLGSGSRNGTIRRVTVGATSSAHAHPDYCIQQDSATAGSVFEWHFDQVYTRRCRKVGMYFEQAYDCTFTECECIPYHAIAGMEIKGASCLIQGCTFSGGPVGIICWGFGNVGIGNTFEMANNGTGLDSACIWLKYDAGSAYTQARDNVFIGGAYDMDDPAETASSGYIIIDGTARGNRWINPMFSDESGSLIRLNDTCFGNSFIGGRVDWSARISQESGDELYNAETWNNGNTDIDGGMNFNANIAVKNGSTSAGYIDIYEDSDNGSNYVRIQGQALSASETMYPIYTDFVDINNAEIKDLADTVIILVSAPGSGKWIEFCGASLWLDYSGGALAEPSSPDDLTITYVDESGAAASAAITGSGFMTATADTMAFAVPVAIAGTAAADIVNKALVLANSGEDYTGAGSTSVMRVIVNYRIHSDTGL